MQYTMLKLVDRRTFVAKLLILNHLKLESTAEAFGLCSILMYLSEMFDSNQEVLPSMKFVCNNEALVDTINQLLLQARPEFPNDTIKPDCDVLQQIRTT